MKRIYSNKRGNCDRSEGGSWEGRREVSVLFSQTADIPSSQKQPKWTYLSNKGSQRFLNSDKVVGQNSWKLVTAGWVALDAPDTAPNTVPYLWVAGCAAASHTQPLTVHMWLCVPCDGQDRLWLYRYTEVWASTAHEMLFLIFHPAFYCSHVVSACSEADARMEV